MKIIAFTGMPFSGKTEAVNVAKDLGVQVVRMGDVVWDEVTRRGLELNDENVGKVATAMREEHGKDIWARRIFEKIRSLDQSKIDDVVVIDGIRNVEEIDFFKEELSEDFLVVAIDASAEIRYKRAMRRDRMDDSKNLELVKERDLREMRFGLDVVIASADIVISNEGGLDKFRGKIKKIVKENLR